MKRWLWLMVLWMGGTVAWAGPLERWVYAPVNHLVPEQITRLERLLERGKAAGYTHFLLADSKFSRLGEMEQRYFDHLARVKQKAGALGLQLVPAVFPVGYSNDMLSQDPNLAEGLPVRGALFEVQQGEARLVADPPVSLPPLSARKRWGFVDDQLVADGGGVKLTDGQGGNARFMVKVKVSPFRHYHASIRVKTQDFEGTPEIKALVPGSDRPLCHTSLKVQRIQDWAVHHVTFNTLEAAEINLYFGVWGAGSGTLWLSDPMLEEAGPVNLLRRPGCPLEVKTLDGKGLVEGTDFERLSDPRLGNQPYAGEYEVWHDAPLLRTRLPEGTRLRVSWYHPHVIHEGQVCAAVTEPAFMKLLEAQAEQVHRAWGARSYMMSHDEWRVLGWDAAAISRRLTPGQVAAGHVQRCTGFLESVNPGGRVMVWSDMFDPHHNAVKDYYLVNGDLTGSWLGLDPKVVVMNWNFGERAKSLAFFSGRGHQQILSGYYDAGPGQIKDWLEAARGVPGVIGVMYTTWQNNYTDLEAFAGHVTAWEKGN